MKYRALLSLSILSAAPAASASLPTPEISITSDLTFASEYVFRGVEFGDAAFQPAIGVFLLWLGWFGFNGGSVLSANPAEVSFVFVTTALAAAGGALASMLFSWGLLKKPDLTMSLNGVLAGLVGITAGADVISPLWALLVGTISGIIVVLSIIFFDKIRIDDPVGAISVHGICGIWGTVAVGIFAPGAATWWIQIVGSLSIIAFTLVFSFAAFGIIRALHGIRVSAEEEETGLDLGEHAQEAYPDFGKASS